VWAAILASDRRDTAELRRHVQALRRFATDDAPAQVVLPAAMFVAYLDLLDGRRDGLERVRAVRDRVMATEAPAPGVPAVATRLVLEGCAVAGQHDAGLALADEAVVMGRGGELWEAEIRRLRAGFLTALGAPDDESEAELEHALAVARRQQARAFEQRIRETLAERSLRHDRTV
jgi:hypothetical protein